MAMILIKHLEMREDVYRVSNVFPCIVHADMSKLQSLVNLNLILDAWGWCTRTTQRDGMGREEGGGFRIGNTCIPGQIHVDVWQNQYNIVK